MAMTSRVRAGVIGLWVLLASGPLLGAAALLRTTVPSGIEASTQPPAHVLAFAELVIADHLAAAAQDRPTHPRFTARVATAPAASGAAGRSGDRGAASSAPTTPPGSALVVGAIASRGAGPARWGVTVAALTGDGTIEAWQATVADTVDGPVSELAPALVALPAPASSPAPRTGTALGEDDPRSAAVAGFVHAWYVQQRDLDRWAAPTSSMAAPGGLPAPAQSATLRSVRATALADGRQVVLAEVALRRGGRSLGTHLPLLMTRRADRWEVTQVLPALPVTAPAAGRSAP